MTPNIEWLERKKLQKFKVNILSYQGIMTLTGNSSGRGESSSKQNETKNKKTIITTTKILT